MSGILAGFEVGTGEPVRMSLHHLACFGMTRLSGKTTLVEGIIARSGLRAIAFRTKRGETGFRHFHEVPAYYKPRADWIYIESLIGVALGEKVKFEPGIRGAIMRVSTGSKDLQDVQRKCQDQLVKAKREFIKDVYTKLSEYLKLVVPEIERHKFSDAIKLEGGINVMDLVDMRRETQSLVIASVMDHIMAAMENVVVVVPEAWEHLPQGRLTPVSLSAEVFIRKGASIGNYLFVDSQDIGGLSKIILRQVDNWLLGRMKEAHEVDRMMKQLLGVKLKPEEIQTLPLGHFYAVVGDKVHRIYALPSGVPEEAGVQVALGKMSPEDVRDRYMVQAQKEEDVDLVWKERYEKDVAELKAKVASRDAEINRLEGLVERLDKVETEAGIAQEKLSRFEALESALRSLLPGSGSSVVANSAGNSLQVDLTPASVTVALKPVQSIAIDMNAVEGAPGKVLQVVIEDELSKGQRQFRFGEIAKSLQERGWNLGAANINNAINSLVAQGIFIKEGEKGRYRLPAKVTVI